MKNSTPNRLIHATSPYLLQHAYNPVNWYEWGPDALEKAQEDNKPILVSIGYSSCHWCHVMERESFEIDAIAKVMNEYFICIKVDREERPDIDQLYMEAVQALGVNGGWPLNVFLTPDRKPFFGGTYFSPHGWVQVLQNIHEAYEGSRNKIEETAEELYRHLQQSDVGRFTQDNPDPSLDEDTQSIYANLASRFDRTWGGLDKAPKFIMPSIWQYLLQYHHIKHDPASLEQISLTLNKILQGGIYDQVGGGFARYSVDGQWFAPHFEKMLYDNAQLISLYADTYSLTKNEDYKIAVKETFSWLKREMTHAEGGFYSALDADSEGTEGLFYVWKKSEMEEILGTDEDLISEYYGVTPAGNWEDGYNILKRRDTDSAFLKEKGLQPDAWNDQLSRAKQKLLQRREARVRPGCDDKIVAGWNAMMVCGLADAYRVFGESEYLDAALLNMQFIKNSLIDGNQLFRSFKGKRSGTEGFLDDYAYLIQAQFRMYQVTFDEQWISEAEKFMVYALEHFYDAADGFFYFTSSLAEKLITRKKEIFDNVIPSSNGIMARNLFLLGTLLDKEEWKQMAAAMTTSLAHLIKTEPAYMSHWAIAYTEINKGVSEVLITGKGFQEIRAGLQKEFYPFLLMQGAKEKSNLPLFEGKVAIPGEDTIYVCRNKTCGLPVHTLAEAIKQFP